MIQTTFTYVYSLVSFMDEKLDIVDEDDEVIDVKTRKEAHDKGLRHRSVMFFVFTPEGKLLMTRRSEDKRFFSGYWSIVLGGHVKSGLSYDEALKKEMEEEIGLVGDYELLGSFSKELEEEKENVKLYKIVVDPGKIELSPIEFESAHLIETKDIEKELEDKKLLPETEIVLDFLKKEIDDRT